MGHPADAFEIMRNKGLGITNSDLANVQTSGGDVSMDAHAKTLDELFGSSFELNWRQCMESELGSGYPGMTESDLKGMFGLDALDLIQDCTADAGPADKITLDAWLEDIAKRILYF